MFQVTWTSHSLTNSGTVVVRTAGFGVLAERVDDSEVIRFLLGRSRVLGNDLVQHVDPCMVAEGEPGLADVAGHHDEFGVVLVMGMTELLNSELLLPGLDPLGVVQANPGASLLESFRSRCLGESAERLGLVRRVSRCVIGVQLVPTLLESGRASGGGAR